MIKILAISGSLRRTSINTKLLEAIALSVPQGSTANRSVKVSQVLGALPLFNPDIEENAPTSVHTFKAQLAWADGVIIASPEYAHGITGVMKNALDWIVGSGDMVEKPIAVLNAAPRSSIAYEALKEVLRTIDAHIVPEASLDVPVLGTDMEPEEMLADENLGPCIQQILLGLTKAIVANSK